MTGFVVSITGKHERRVLHKLGACWRVPGLDYEHFEELGVEMPGGHLFDDYCRSCWKQGAAAPTSLVPEDLEDVQSFSEGREDLSSSSAAEEEEEGKKEKEQE